MKTLIMYCAGYVKNHISGCGIHGYIYNTNDIAKKNTNAYNYTCTNIGYMLKEEIVDEYKVIPIKYIDASGIFDGITTSVNSVELHTLAKTVNLISTLKDDDIKSVIIYISFTDVEAIRSGYKTIWESINASIEVYKRNNIDVLINIISSPNTVKNIGTSTAEQLAYIITNNVNLSIGEFKISLDDNVNYWKHDVCRHPLLSEKIVYFNTLTTSTTAGTYFLGNSGRDDELLGHKNSCMYAVVILDEPDNIIEMIRNHHHTLAGKINNMAIIRLDELYKVNTHMLLSKYGVDALKKDSKKNDLYTISNEPITRELVPPLLALRAIIELNDLAGRLYNYINYINKPNKQITNLILTDITYLLYDIIPGKKDGITVKRLKTDFTNEVKTFKALVKYFNLGDMNKDRLTPDSNLCETTNIELTFGIDIVNRNALKKIEDLNPIINIMTWSLAVDIFGYAIIIDTCNSKAIYGSSTNNIRVIFKNNKIN